MKIPLYYLLQYGIILFLGIVNYSCNQEKVDELDWSKSLLRDSTFKESHANFYFDSMPTIGNELKLLPLSSYSGEAIRVRNQNGWGIFDAIATIYREEDCKIQMIKQNANYPRRGFEIQEYMFSDSICDDIFSLVNNPSFLNLPYNLDPERKILDGNVYSIAYKGVKKKHLVTWQVIDKRLVGTEYYGLEKEKNIARSIYYKLFKESKRTPPCINFYLDTMVNDSFVYLSGIEESYDYFDSLEYTCENCRVQYLLDDFDVITQKVELNDYGYPIREISVTLISTEGDEINSDCVLFIDK